MAQLLVVEDNPDILHLIWTSCAPGATRSWARHRVQKPWRRWNGGGPPQVAVLDVAMPSMDGLELLQRRAATGMHELPQAGCSSVGCSLSVLGPFGNGPVRLGSG
jgi:CheY-like chemotaxis protein